MNRTNSLSVFLNSIVEVGSFTGYTALTIASILPSDGQLIACDISDKYIRHDLWENADVDKKITLKIGPAVDTLKQLLEENGEGTFDFVFIDADKTNYLNYYELSLKLIRSNGFIAIDNTLWNGQVIDESDQTENTVAIRQINDFVRDDQRVDVSFLRLGDGTTLCRKKFSFFFLLFSSYNFHSNKINMISYVYECILQERRRQT